MQVAHGHFRRDAKEVLVSREGGAEVLETLDTVEITDVRAHMGRVAADERERVLEVRPYSQERLGRRNGKPQREWRVAPGAAQ